MCYEIYYCILGDIEMRDIQDSSRDKQEKEEEAQPLTQSTQPLEPQTPSNYLDVTENSQATGHIGESQPAEMRILSEVGNELGQPDPQSPGPGSELVVSEARQVNFNM